MDSQTQLVGGWPQKQIWEVGPQNIDGRREVGSQNRGGRLAPKTGGRWEVGPQTDMEGGRLAPKTGGRWEVGSQNRSEMGGSDPCHTLLNISGLCLL